MHEVVQAVFPSARIVYVDDDPVLCPRPALLASRPEGQTAPVDANLRGPAEILAQAAGALDLASRGSSSSSDSVT